MRRPPQGEGPLERARDGPLEGAGWRGGRVVLQAAGTVTGISGPSVAPCSSFRSSPDQKLPGS
jgi:hypothetical protein